MGVAVILVIVCTVLVLHPAPVKTSNGGCDYSQGSWVEDHSYPLYDADSCPFIEKIFTCQKNGRPDETYLHQRWQPSCRQNLPRFNGKRLLSKLKGKQVMFVGDSLSLNQWQSLTCMLHTSVPQTNAKDWEGPINGSCKGETESYEGRDYSGGPHPAEVVLEKILAPLKKAVHLLNITLLSQYRKDGHPSVYGLGGMRGNDCTHWCLPGVPDTWNLLLYAALKKNH
ncbi:hypothetical protein L6164_031168 [Bauhinia variegata]|uniref:Uncharacterized protein n=1 Tax=Bauhinia variegata TaxID=167791 RepID=A0ACB9LER3_BAUVA|nr:hypothetical protein L6164_031168 [Bauhinia variegata]